MEALEKSEETVSNVTPRMPGTVNWGTATVVGIFAGMLYGGSKEASASVSKDAEVMLKLGSTPDKREQYRLMRDAMEKRFIKVTRGSIVGEFALECSLLHFVVYRICFLRNEGCMIFIMLLELVLPLPQHLV